MKLANYLANYSCSITILINLKVVTTTNYHYPTTQAVCVPHRSPDVSGSEHSLLGRLKAVLHCPFHFTVPTMAIFSCNEWLVQLMHYALAYSWTGSKVLLHPHSNGCLVINSCMLCVFHIIIISNLLYFTCTQKINLMYTTYTYIFGYRHKTLNNL